MCSRRVCVILFILKEEEEKPVAKIIRKENKKTKIQSLG
jgi:hypothetical protein